MKIRPVDRRHSGFTLIEVVIIIAIQAIIAAIAIPNLIEARKGSNEAAAIGAMRTLVTAQSLFREGDKDKNGILDYAQTLTALAENGNLIDNVLATGRDHGYSFYLTTSPDRLHWKAIASAAAPNRTGDRSFFVDDSGVISFIPCPPGQTLSNGQCVPADSALQSYAVGAIEQLNALSGGTALANAKEQLRSGTLVQIILRRLDANQDGSLTFAEVLHADLRKVVDDVLHDTGEHQAPNNLTTLVQVYQNSSRRVLTDIALRIANENTLPAVQLTALKGDVIAFLDTVPTLKTPN